MKCDKERVKNVFFEYHNKCTCYKNKKSMRITFISIILLLSSIAFSQQKVTKLTYQQISNTSINTDKTHDIYFTGNLCYLSETDAKTQEWIDYDKNELVDLMTFDDILYKTIEKFEDAPKAISDEESEQIMKFETRKAKYLVFSNTIEVWYTTESKTKGSPYKSYLPKDALVLKILINGSRGWQLAKIKKNVKMDFADYPYQKAKTITKPEARELQIEARYVNFPVFDKAQINWGDSMVNPERNQSNLQYRFAGGTVIMKKVKLPEISKQGSQVFATLTNWSNGDAYDRTGSLFTISDKKGKSILNAYLDGVEQLPVITDNNGEEYQGFVSTENYETPVELMRFFTSFGVNHFNNLRAINNYDWRDSVVYKQEISNLIPNDKDEVWLGVWIGNYDKGGHYVSLDLQFYPAWEPINNPEQKFILPLFNTVNTLEMKGQNYGKMFANDTLEVEFEIPEGLENAQLLYTTTGHGGWGGGDEFNPKLNQIFVDEKPAFNIVPWRTDCGTYRMSNPASGNFGNGLSSSDLSRSNWCPATLTPPYIIPLKDLSPGKHTVQVVIDMGAPEGNSFSSWSVTGVITGTIKNKE